MREAPMTLTFISDRPKDIVATGKTGGDGRWNLTEFKGEDGNIYIKYQRFVRTRKGNEFARMNNINPAMANARVRSRLSGLCL